MKIITLVLLILVGFTLISCDFSSTGGPLPDKPVLDIVWSHTYADAGESWGIAVLETDDGGFLLLGNAYEGNDNVWLQKVDTDGDSLWRVVYGQDQMGWGLSLIPTDDGGYMIAGMSDRSMSESSIALLKTDAAGNPVWNQVLAEPAECWAMDVAQTADGGYVLAAEQSPPDTSQTGIGSTWLVRTDEQGDSLWMKEYYGYCGNRVVTNPDGGYTVAGYTFGVDADIWLLRTDDDGNTSWNQTYNLRGGEIANSLERTSDGGYIICGSSYDAAYRVWCYLMKTDGDGNPLWTRYYGEDNYGYCVRQTDDEGFIVCGYTRDLFSPVSFPIGLVIKTDSFGLELWQDNIDIGWSENPLDIQQTSQGDYILAGHMGNAAWLMRVEEL